ncbi:DUF6233 domain-containing protein [Streptomyces sp. NPDC048420]|uniref:DUF6233 domain-containing protein n=1 Tax=Streptomyces sp. NPDC048420 TaxID=3155755 RepID=UPI00343787E8
MGGVQRLRRRDRCLRRGLGRLKPRHGTHDARLALADAQMEACAFCRPDTELGSSAEGGARRADLPRTLAR